MRLMLLILCGFYLSNCSENMAEIELFDHPAIRISTNLDQYQLASNDSIEVRIHNISKSIVYFNTCFPGSRRYYLVDNKIQETRSLYTAECLIAGELEPNEIWFTQRATVPLDNPNDIMWIEGTYQFYLPVFSDAQWRTMLDQRYLRSNKFMVVR